MLIVWIFELLAVTLLLVLTFTQLIVPLWKNTPLFPLLRKRRREVESRLTTAREEVEIAKLEKDTARESSRAEGIRTPRNRPRATTNQD